MLLLKEGLKTVSRLEKVDLEVTREGTTPESRCTHSKSVWSFSSVTG